jgi:hypothetical protein
MDSRQNSLLLVLLTGFLVLILYLSDFLNVGYYTSADLLGPTSKFPTVFMTLALTVALIAAYVFLNASQGKLTISRALILVSPVVLLILYMMLLPDAVEKYMVTNHKDVLSHMARASYVLENGRTDIRVDYYFDMQPGVFYATAAFMLVTGIDAYVISKWFPLLFVVAVYVPALVFLGKSFFSSPRELMMFVFLSLVVNWTNRYHYSAQVYMLPLFAIVVGMLIRGMLDRKRIIVILLIGAAMVVTHQGVTLFTLAACASILLLNGVQRLFFGKSKQTGGLLILAVSLSMMWFLYLGWFTTYTFAEFVVTLRNVGVLILTEPFTEIFLSAIARPNATYQTVVYAKVAFTAATYIVGFLVLIRGWLRQRLPKMGSLLAVIVGVSSIIYILGFALGGAAYVERAVLTTGPLLAIALTLAMSNIRSRKLMRVLPLFLILLTMTGMVLFNSNRNFESKLYSEDACNVFLTANDPIRIPADHSIRVTIPRYTYDNVGNAGKIPSGIFVVQPSYIIESSYWVPQSVLMNVTTTLIEKPGELRFYSNGECSMYYAT